MMHTSSVGGTKFDNPSSSSHFPVASRVAPQFWPYTSPAEPTTCYGSPPAGATTTRRRISSDLNRGIGSNHYDILHHRAVDSRVDHHHYGVSPTPTTYYGWREPLDTARWPSNPNPTGWIPPPPTTIDPLLQRAGGFSPFGPSIQSEFLRSYNRAIQTYCIISSFLYYYPVSAPLIQQAKDQELTDFWVDTTSQGPEDAPSSPPFNTESSSPEFVQEDVRKRTHFLSDRTQGSTLASAPTGSSRTRSPSPDETESVAISTTRRHLHHGEFDEASTTHAHQPLSLTSAASPEVRRFIRTDSTGVPTTSMNNLIQLRVARSESELLRFRSVSGFIKAARDPWLYWKAQQYRQQGMRQSPIAQSCWPLALYPGLQNQGVRARNQIILLRPSRFDVLRAMWIDTATTTIQRHWRGHLGRRRAAAERQWREWKREVTLSATRIQRQVRRFLRRLEEEREAICEFILWRRRKAALVIQRFWKNRKRIEAQMVEQLIAEVREMRYESAVAIQRSYRGFKARKLIDLEYKRWLVTWRWDPASKVVELVGSFTTPPWTSRILMSWDPMSRQYVVDLPRIPGRHEMKFVVDGDFCCDGSLTVISDGAGHYNNVVYISPATSESPLKCLRDRLRLRELRDDPVFVAPTTTDNNNNKTPGLPRPRSCSLRDVNPSKESFTKRSYSTADSFQPEHSPFPARGVPSRGRQLPSIRPPHSSSPHDASCTSPTGTHSHNSNREESSNNNHVASFSHDSPSLSSASSSASNHSSDPHSYFDHHYHHHHMDSSRSISDAYTVHSTTNHSTTIDDKVNDDRRRSGLNHNNCSDSPSSLSLRQYSLQSSIDTSFYPSDSMPPLPLLSRHQLLAVDEEAVAVPLSSSSTNTVSETPLIASTSQGLDLHHNDLDSSL